VAGAADATAAYWNPALLATLRRSALGMGYVRLVEGTGADQAYLAYARPLARLEGSAIARYALGVIYGGLDLDPQGGQYREHELTLAYAVSPDYFLSLGVSLSLLASRSSYDQLDSWGTAVSAGLRVRLRPGLTLGLVARNLASRISYHDGFDLTLGRSFTLGVSYLLRNRLSLEADALVAHRDLARLTLGGEFEAVPGLLYLRGAIGSLHSGESRTVPHLGLGVAWKRAQLDYSAELEGEEALGNRHRFSLSIGL